MASLTLGPLELIGGTYTATLGTSMGDWESITSATGSLFLDGSVVSGEATGNREIPLQVFVQADTRPALIAACDTLISEANRSTNLLIYTPDTGPAVVYEVFRAQPSQTDDRAERKTDFFRTYELTIPALPFARSNIRRNPAATFPPGTGGSVTIVAPFSPAATAGVSAAAYSGEFLGTEAARNFLQGIPITKGSGGTAETFVVDNEPGLVLGGMSAVSNCSVTSTSNQRNVVATGAGAAVANSTTPRATSADSVLVGVALDASTSADLVLQVGVEWFNGGTSIFTDWGSPTFQADDRPAWAASPRPSAATHWGFRLKVTAASAGQSVRVVWVLGQEHTFATLVGVVSLQPAAFSSFVFRPAASWMYLTPASAVDISSQTHLQVSLKRENATESLVGSNVRFKLHTTGGKWSAYDYRPDAAENTAFGAGATQTKFFDLTAPDAVSDLGAATLTSVGAFSAEVLADGRGLGAALSNAPLSFPEANGGLGPGVAPPSTRGIVYDLDTIIGSARSPAAVHASAGVAMTDLILQAVDPADGPPLLQFTSSVAIAAAPHGYDGVYSMAATRISGADPVSPVLTITQKQDGDIVATRALDGWVRPGGHYVDFGTISLPLVHHSAENLGVSLEFAVTPTGAGWGESLQLNTNSPLMMLEQIDPAVKNVFIDEPAIETGIGRVLTGNETDRTDAMSPILPPILSLPFTVRAPGVKIFAYSTSDGPSIDLSYFDRWLVEPV